MARLVPLLLFILLVSGTSLQQPSSPTLCTAANQGRCECANLLGPSSFSPLAKGGETYTWWVQGEQRCLTTYVPGSKGSNSSTSSFTSSSSSSMPTVLYLQCYGRDRLQALDRGAIESADRFGLALAYLSSPDGAWSWNTSVVNDTSPLPCSAATAGEDYTYVSAAIGLLKTKPFFDKSRVYTYGFSQNGMASAYVGRCFPSDVTGQWIGGGGLFSVGHGPVPPNKAGTCAGGCKYWPAFPCHSAKASTSVQSCIQFYSNDPVTVDQRDPADPSQPRTKGHGLYLFDRLATEANDGRMLQFFPDEDHQIRGGHSGPKNVWDWVASCFGGFTPPCSAACESALPSCMQSQQGQTPAAAFSTCLTDTLVASGTCAAGCTASFDMLQLGEKPQLNLTKGSRWGKPAVIEPRPSTSICEA